MIQTLSAGTFSRVSCFWHEGFLASHVTFLVYDTRFVRCLNNQSVTTILVCMQLFRRLSKTPLADVFTLTSVPSLARVSEGTVVRFSAAVQLVADHLLRSQILARCPGS